MERSDAGVSSPGKHQPPRAAAADHLIVKQVRCHPDQREIGLLLTDNFMPGGEWNEVGEPFKGNRRARRNEPGYRFRKGKKLNHLARISIQPFRGIPFSREKSPAAGGNRRLANQREKSTLGAFCASAGASK